MCTTRKKDQKEIIKTITLKSIIEKHQKPSNMNIKKPYNKIKIKYAAKTNKTLKH